MKEFLAPLKYAKKLRIAEPCVGLGGMRELARVCDFEYSQVNAYDIEPKLRGFYQKYADAFPMDGNGIHTVKFVDLTTVSASELEDADGLTTGAPCQGWAGAGNRKSIFDDREDVFTAVVKWVMELGWRGCLLFFAIENSSNIMDKRCGLRTSYADQVIGMLRASIPFFEITVDVQNVKELHPHQRNRAWVRGMMRDLLYGQPIPRPMLTTPVALEDLLLKGVPNMKASDISTEVKRKVYARQLERIKEDVENQRAGRVATFETGRDPTNLFSAKIFYDCTPALRTKGPEIFLMSTWDINKPEMERAFHRPLHDRERFLLQGHSADLLDMFPDKTSAWAACGNAYAVPQLASMVAPMLRRSALMDSAARHLNEEQLRSLIKEKITLDNKRKIRFIS